MGIFGRKRTSDEGEAALIRAKAIYLRCKATGTSNEDSQQMTALLKIAREHGLIEEAETLLKDYAFLVNGVRF